MRESGQRRSLAVAATVLAALCLVSPAAHAATTWTVTASGTDMATAQFAPKFLTIQVGDTVKWVNQEGVHNVVSDTDVFVSGSVEPPNGSSWPFSFTFTNAGTFPYYCSIHGNVGGVGQSGVIYVRPAHPANDIAYEKSAWDFSALDPSTVTLSEMAFYRSISGGVQQLSTGILLPSGSTVTGLEITGCDDSDTDDVSAELWACPDPGEACESIVKATSSGAFGCDFFSSTLASGPTIDNLTNSYVLTANLGLGSKTRFRNVRVFYKRVVSPAPLTATFADVPTNNQFFRVIEALAASGITQGCGNGNFCPNDVVTRASMASFLARALGLFWPN